MPEFDGHRALSRGSLLVGRARSGPASPQRKHRAIPDLGRREGLSNQVTQHLLRSSGGQGTLTVRAPDDVYQGETNRVAEPVTPLPDPRVQRQAEPEEDDEELVQAAQTSGQTRQVGSELASQIDALRRGGRPLRRAEREFFEPRFRRDFADVRLHTGSEAIRLAKALKAQAFTVGQDVVFGARQYALGTYANDRLMAHELTHTAQQGLAGERIQRHGTHSNVKTAIDKYRHTLQHAGTSQASWERGLDRRATFLGQRIRGGIHRELGKRLKRAEAYLHSRPDHRKLSDDQIAKRLNIYSVSGRRSPGRAVGGTRVSLHAFGLAIDVNYRGNPFVARSKTVRDILQRAYYVIYGKGMDLWTLNRREPVSRLHTYYRFASDALRQYFGFRHKREKARLIGHVRHHFARKTLVKYLRGIGRKGVTDANVYDELQEQITRDYRNRRLRREFVRRDPAKGFIDLNHELLVALVKKGGLLWGGQYRKGKDIMHFDWRRGTVRDAHRV